MVEVYILLTWAPPLFSPTKLTLICMNSTCMSMKEVKDGIPSIDERKLGCGVVWLG